MRGAPALRSVVAGLHTDLDAVTAGLTLDDGRGVVQGIVNRIKMIKRQMFGQQNSTYYASESSTQPERRPMPSTKYVPEPASVITTGEDQVESSVDHFRGDTTVLRICPRDALVDSGAAGRRCSEVAEGQRDSRLGVDLPSGKTKEICC